VVAAEGRDPATGEQVGAVERVVAAASLGASAAGGPAFTAGQLAKFEGQLAKHGLNSVLKSQRKIQKRLNQHLDDLARYRAAGGYTSSVEREIRTFRGELAAIEEILGRNR